MIADFIGKTLRWALDHRGVTALLGIVLIVSGVLFIKPDHGTKTVSAEFTRAVSVYVGTDVRVLGVSVGRVTRVTPAGNAVRVDMEYDATVPLPADAKAVVVTPTLVADRFVQLTPAYTGGDVMASGAVIGLPDTGVPVELDRIYASLKDLSVALGPNGVNKDGSLDHVLSAAAQALDGKGALANETLVNLAAAAKTFGEGSGDLFATVEQLARFTDTLASNDALVRTFIKDLAGLSSQLAGERFEIQRAVASVARAVGTVRVFVGKNRSLLVRTVKQLTRVSGTIASERDSIDAALRTGPVAIGNLLLAFNNQTHSIGSRISIQNTVADADGVLCSIVQQSALPKASKDLACRLFELLTPLEEQIIDQSTKDGPLLPGLPDIPGVPGLRTTTTQPTQPTSEPTLGSLMGAAQ
jgi:phospholipid/cholesterol/gamma-HCH transport system substrate-binding protein